MGTKKVVEIAAWTTHSGYFWGAVKTNIVPLLRVMDLFVVLNDKKNLTLIKIRIDSRTSDNIVSFTVVTLRGCCRNFTLSFKLFNFVLILERGRKEEEGRERNVNFLFHLLMHSLVASCMCPAWGWNSQPWHTGMQL